MQHKHSFNILLFVKSWLQKISKAHWSTSLQFYTPNFKSTGQASPCMTVEGWKMTENSFICTSFCLLFFFIILKKKLYNNISHTVQQDAVKNNKDSKQNKQNHKKEKNKVKHSKTKGNVKQSLQTILQHQ